MDEPKADVYTVTSEMAIKANTGIIRFKDMFVFYIQVSDGKVLLNLNYLDKFFNENPFISIVLQLLTRAYGTQWGTKRLNQGARVTELGYP